MIKERDCPILRAFLDRESQMYNWARTGEEGRKAFVNRMFEKLTQPTAAKLDYIHIQSISNVGLLESELVLTALNWGHGRSLYALLPPSPKGGIGHCIKDGM